MEILLQPIGTIYTPFEDPRGMPIQPSGANAVEGRVVLLPQFEEGLADLEDFSHLILIYHFHRARGFNLTVTPFLDTHPHGLFATRAPRRPNPIGLSIVTLRKRNKNELIVLGIDVVNQTPLLDLKPYVPLFDAHPTAKAGWLETRAEDSKTFASDDRFVPPEK